MKSGAIWAIAPLAVLALLVLAFGAMLARGGGERGFSKTGMSGAAAPSYDLASLDGGGALTPASFAGKPYLVNFFASWCVPCRQEAPALMALSRQGVPILGIAYKDAPEKTKQLLDQLGNPYVKVGLDPNGRTGIDFGVTGVPETYVVSADGKIVTLYRLPLDAESISTVIQPALKRAAQ
jgi:cytochrome c biogenesis protein CcmG/thiol:disulfide interchange protein DsbE